MFTDTHCHVFKQYYDNIEEVIRSAEENGVNRLINNGFNFDTNKEVLEIIKNPIVFGSLGIHPSEADIYLDSDLKFIEDNLGNPKIIAVGEIGLDYHYGKENREKQIELFEAQLKLAEKYNLPVIIHNRKATEDIIDILKKYSVKGVMHCFTRSKELADTFIKMGFLLGINGMITYENNNLKDVIEKISLEYIVLETDCPYLSPEGFRNEQNRPEYLMETAKFIADLKGISLEELAQITNQNIARIFDI